MADANSIRSQYGVILEEKACRCGRSPEECAHGQGKTPSAAAGTSRDDRRLRVSPRAGQARGEPRAGLFAVEIDAATEGVVPELRRGGAAGAVAPGRSEKESRVSGQSRYAKAAADFGGDERFVEGRVGPACFRSTVYLFDRCGVQKAGNCFLSADDADSRRF